jgi:hypothetical protein
VDDPIALKTLYVSARVDLPPRTAAAAFDALPTAHLHPVDTSGPSEIAIRRSVGRLPLAWRVSVGVEIELALWSEDSCEIGVRPIGRMVPVSGGWRRERYLNAARPLVDSVSDAIVAVVESWQGLALAEAGDRSRSAA